jgi:hypothetical protein
LEVKNREEFHKKHFGTYVRLRGYYNRACCNEQHNRTYYRKEPAGGG